MLKLICAETRCLVVQAIIRKSRGLIYCMTLASVLVSVVVRLNYRARRSLRAGPGQVRPESGPQALEPTQVSTWAALTMLRMLRDLLAILRCILVCECHIDFMSKSIVRALYLVVACDSWNSRSAEFIRPPLSRDALGVNSAKKHCKQPILMLRFCFMSS